MMFLISLTTGVLLYSAWRRLARQTPALAVAPAPRAHHPRG